MGQCWLSNNNVRRHYWWVHHQAVAVQEAMVLPRQAGCSVTLDQLVQRCQTPQEPEVIVSSTVRNQSPSQCQLSCRALQESSCNTIQCTSKSHALHKPLPPWSLTKAGKIEAVLFSMMKAKCFLFPETDGKFGIAFKKKKRRHFMLELQSVGTAVMCSSCSKFTCQLTSGMYF